MFTNLKTLFSSSLRILAYFILVGLAFLVWYNFTDTKIMIGNYGKFHTYFDISLSMIMVFSFPLFIVALWYRSWKFGKKENLSKKTGIGLISGIAGTIISGASCCGLTLASYFGLLPLLGFLPYSGLEVKVIGVIGLVYALWSILTDLETCKIRK